MFLVSTKIEKENAEDAEDNGNSKRHEIENKDYSIMDLDALVDEFNSLVKKNDFFEYAMPLTGGIEPKTQIFV